MEQSQLANRFAAMRAINKVVDKINPLDVQVGGEELKKAVQSARIDAGITPDDFLQINRNVISESNSSDGSPASRLPIKILESLKANPPQDINSTYGTSVLDYTGMAEKLQPISQKMRIDEDLDYPEEDRPLPSIGRMQREMASRTIPAYNQQPQIQATPQPQQVQSAPINYDIINALIKTAVAEEFSKLKKMLGNEVLIVKVGKDLQLVDGKGNVFSGNMKRTGKLE